MDVALDLIHESASGNTGNAGFSNEKFIELSGVFELRRYAGPGVEARSRSIDPKPGLVQGIGHDLSFARKVGPQTIVIGRILEQHPCQRVLKGSGCADVIYVSQRGEFSGQISRTVSVSESPAGHRPRLRK